MTTAEFLTQLRNLGVTLWRDGDRLRFSAPDGAMTGELRARLADRKEEILAFLRQAGAARAVPSLRPVPRDRPLPLSLAQQRLWLLHQLAPHDSAYNISQAVRLEGELDVAALRRTIDALVRRHEILRTTFLLEGDEPRQRIGPAQAIPLSLVDLSGLPQAEAEARRLAARDARQPFDLAQGPLMRVALVRLGATDHVVLFTLHHIVADGWSVSVLVREVAALYAAFSQGRPSPLPELPVQYADYACWQQEWLGQGALEEQRAYWREELAGASPVLELPADRPRGLRQTSRGAHHGFTLAPALSEALLALSRRENASLFITLATAFFALLHRYTGRRDLVIGTPVGNRSHAELEGLIGYFVNTLLLRARLSGDPTYRQQLARVRETVLGAFAHQDLPLERLLPSQSSNRGRDRLSLVNVAFALQNAPSAALHVPGLTLRPLEVDETAAKTDLILFMSEGPDGLRGLWEYNADLFDASTMARMAGHFQDVLQAVADDPDRRLSALPPFAVELPRAAPGARSRRALDELYERSNLTRNQLLIWAGQQLQPDVPLFNIANIYTISRGIFPDHFRRAFQTLVNSSDALRTVIETRDGAPWQTVLPEVRADVECLDFSHLPDPRAEVERWAQARAQALFDFSRPLLDTVLIKTAEEEYVWFLKQHHIIADLWSKSLTFQNVAELYGRSLEGRLEEAIAIPSFSKYVEYERAYRDSRQYAESEAYWQAKLAEPLEPLSFCGKSPPKRTTHVRRISCALGLERSQRLLSLAAERDFLGRTRDVWLFGMFAAVLYTYLYRTSGARRISIGAGFHNRRSPAFRNTIGMLMEARPLRLTIDPRDTFQSLIDKVSAEAAEAFRHRHYAVENPIHKPAYDVLLNYQAVNFTDFLGSAVETKWIHSGHENDSLAVQIHDFGLSCNFVIDFDFHCDVFDEDDSARAIRHFLHLLDALLDDRHQPVHRVPMLSSEERRRLVDGFNHRATRYSGGRTAVERFELQAARMPDKVAAVGDGRSVTLAALDDRADKLARVIRRLMRDS